MGLYCQALKGELEAKLPTMDKLCSMSQDLLFSVKNKDVASKLEARLDSFAQRWDRLVQNLERNISQVGWSSFVLVDLLSHKQAKDLFLHFTQ